MITLPIEIGDTILTGKFRNKPVVVKEIGTDEHGLPTVNGRGIMKIRIEKLMKPKKLRESEINIGRSIPVKIKKDGGRYCICRISQPDGEEIPALNRDFGSKAEAERAAKLRGFVLVNDKFEPQSYEADKYPKTLKTTKEKVEYVVEAVKLSLKELEVTDPELESKIAEAARLSDSIDRLQNEITKLKAQYAPIAEELTEMLDELAITGDRALETKNVLVTIKKMGNPKVEVAAYKDRYEWLFERVNGAMKKQELAAWEAVKKFKKIPTSIGVQYKEPVGEGKLSTIWSKVKGFFGGLLNKLKSQNRVIDTQLAEFKRFVMQNK